MTGHCVWLFVIHRIPEDLFKHLLSLFEKILRILHGTDVLLRRERLDLGTVFGKIELPHLGLSVQEQRDDYCCGDCNQYDRNDITMSFFLSML